MAKSVLLVCPANRLKRLGRLGLAARRKRDRATSASLLQTDNCPVVMSQDLKQELTEMVGPAEWRWLSPHAERGAVVLVDGNLDLADVGVAIATDDVATVNHWLAEALLAKPSPQQIQAWEQAIGQQFQSLIVQPFVLVQEASTSAP